MRDKEAFWKSIEETESRPDGKLTPGQMRHLFFLMACGDDAAKKRATEVQQRHRVEFVNYLMDRRRRMPEEISILKDEYEKTHGHADDRCINCGYELDTSDKYCKCCGTKVDIDEDLKEVRYYECLCMECVYGPLPVGTHTCVVCGHKWSVWGIQQLEKEKYCPECGKKRAQLEFRPGFFS